MWNAERRLRLAVALGALALALGCGSRPSAGGAAGQPPQPAMRTITDLEGNQVAVPEHPKRVALLGGPSGQMAYILGAQDRLCAVTNTLRLSRLAQEIYPNVASLPAPRTTDGSVNVEELIASDPELVIAGGMDAEIIRRKTKIPLAQFADTMNEGYESMIREVRFYGEAFNAGDRAERYVQYLEDRMRLLKERTANLPDSARPLVYNGYDASHLVTFGGDTFLDERIRLAGCRNASAPVRTIGKREGLHSGLGEVSFEEILKWNPDILIINTGSPEELQKQPTWRAVKAVQRRQVYLQPAGIFIWNRPTAESTVLYPLWLATIAHPDLFRDLDMKAEVHRFYQEVFQVDLSADQVGRILSGDYERQIMRGTNPGMPGAGRGMRGSS
jgi:iron complex transport system substrate-binding protein